jgi:ribonucleoside-diphosphate reductase alpha chain
MKFERVFSICDDYINMKWKTVDCVIKSGNGEVIFEQKDVEVPEHWSQTATNILAQKYFRKAGIPDVGRETSARQVFTRLAGCWTYWWGKEGYFDTDEDKNVFYNEIWAMLALQIAAPNSPQFFNCGLHWAYGIKGPELTGHYAFDKDGTVTEVKDTYPRPQVSACFLLSVKDDLINPGGIMDLWLRESKLFRLGSGAGSNFSVIRGKGEKLSGGGVSSGLMSFLRVGDRSAGAIKSGGTSRRAALMRILDLDHPEIEDFIDWKVHEEEKAAAIAVGSRLIRENLYNIYWNVSRDEDISFIVNMCLGNGIPQALIDRVVQDAKSGKEFDWKTYDIGFESEAIETVSGQNANNSVRIPDRFMKALDDPKSNWNLTNRVDGQVYKSVPVNELWSKICYAAWCCADPGVQFQDTINSWNTCANDGEIITSNPCSEYLFLTNTACNLASINLVKFWDGERFNVEKYKHAIRLWTVVLDISVGMASYPSREIAKGSYNYRTLGLGYANLGALLMRMAIPYDSEKGRGIAADLTAILTGQAYQTSAEMAEQLGAFPRWEANRGSMRRVLHNHRSALYEEEKFVDLNITPYKPKRAEEYNYINSCAIELWQRLPHKGKFRNAFVSLVAPTGTISLVMDCDTTGIEPEFSLVRYKSLAGGGMLKFVNQSISEALCKLDYDCEDRESIIDYIQQHDTIEGSPLKEEHLPIFDCAVSSGNGVRSLFPMAHLLMVAAVQPFLSGGVSKTINMPNNTNMAYVSYIYKTSWKYGLKSVSMYRDGSKLTQPLTTKQQDTPEKLEWNFKVLKVPSQKHKLPNKRTGYTQRATINGQRIYHRTGEYPNGSLGEIFIDLAKEGSTMRALMNAIAISVSIGLQNGVPLQQYVEEFVHMKFEPAGPVQDHQRIKFASSLLDYIFRDLAVNYLNREDLAHIREDTKEIEDNKIGYEKIKLFNMKNDAENTGYTGDICDICHNATMLRNGTCLRCETCGSTSGCS